VKRPTKKQRQEFWKRFDEIAAAVPDEEWAKLPKDLVENFDHYLEEPARRK
jgi:type I restriction enzyme S subunit